MKYLYALLILCLTSVLTSAEGLKKVHDKHSKNQVNSSVFSQWKHTPNAYYTVLARNYRKDFYSNEKQMKEMLAAAYLTYVMLDSTHNHVDSIYQMEKIKHEDRLITNNWETAKYLDLINKHKKLIKERMDSCKVYEMPENQREILNSDLTRINDQFKTINLKHLENSKRKVALDRILNEYSTLLGVASRMEQMYYVTHKHKRLLNKKTHE